MLSENRSTKKPNIKEIRQRAFMIKFCGEPRNYSHHNQVRSFWDA
jgi:hypothetical protein